MGKKKEQYCPLTRWRYFTKTPVSYTHLTLPMILRV